MPLSSFDIEKMHALSGNIVYLTSYFDYLFSVLINQWKIGMPKSPTVKKVTSVWSNMSWKVVVFAGPNALTRG